MEQMPPPSIPNFTTATVRTGNVALTAKPDTQLCRTCPSPTRVRSVGVATTASPQGARVRVVESPERSHDYPEPRAESEDFGDLPPPDVGPSPAFRASGPPAAPESSPPKPKVAAPKVPPVFPPTQVSRPTAVTSPRFGGHGSPKAPGTTSPRGTFPAGTRASPVGAAGRLSSPNFKPPGIQVSSTNAVASAVQPAAAKDDDKGWARTAPKDKDKGELTVIHEHHTRKSPTRSNTSAFAKASIQLTGQVTVLPAVGQSPERCDSLDAFPEPQAPTLQPAATIECVDCG
jgi:hypothetical protein